MGLLLSLKNVRSIDQSWNFEVNVACFTKHNTSDSRSKSYYIYSP